jgi:hypothetical protein
MRQPEIIEPALAPPGAGVPWPELMFGRLMFGCLRLAWSRRAALHQFLESGRRLAGRIRALDDSVGSRRVLVPRLTGLEDSSRFWSPFMIAQHLFVVNRDALAIIESLCDGRAPDGEVRIANLKPDPRATRNAVDDLEKSIDSVAHRIPGMANWPGLTRHRHPWFGPLNAHGWLCMVAMHHGIHFRQLQCVLTRPGNESEH